MIKLMVDRIKVINELESLLQQCFSRLDDLLSIQKISQTDYHSLPTTTRIRISSNNTPNLTTAHDLLVDKFGV